MTQRKKSSVDPATFDPNSAAKLGSGIYGLPFSEEMSRVVLVPMPWDVTTSYRRGTAGGPKAIYDASMQVDLYDAGLTLEPMPSFTDYIKGEPYKRGIFLRSSSKLTERLNREEGRRALPIIRRGGDLGRSGKLRHDLERINGACASLNVHLYNEVRGLLACHKIVGVIGGDHSVPFGSIKAHAEKFPGMGILHIDAHADLRQAYEGFKWSHASIMYNVMAELNGVCKLVQVGIRDVSKEEVNRMSNVTSQRTITTFFDENLKERLHRGEHWYQLCEEIAETLPMDVYLSFDIDGLDPQLCPHTGTPVPGGLSFDQVVTLLRVVARRRKIVGFDLCEVAPGPRGDEWDGNVAARLLYKMIGYTLLSQEKT